MDRFPFSIESLFGFYYNAASSYGKFILSEALYDD